MFKVVTVNKRAYVIHAESGRYWAYCYPNEVVANRIVEAMLHQSRTQPALMKSDIELYFRPEINSVVLSAQYA